jgi:copper transport protein
MILLAKLGLVAGLLALAAINKLRLTPALARDERHASMALRGTVAAEIGLALAILIATAALGTTPPPRALDVAAETHAGHLRDAYPHHPSGLSATVVHSGRRVDIALTSNRSGINNVQIKLSDRTGVPIGAKEVVLIAANPSAGVEPIRRTAELVGPGTWHIRGLVLIPAGEWSIRVDALVSDFEKPNFETIIELR